jgi:hypothetical protein
MMNGVTARERPQRPAGESGGGAAPGPVAAKAAAIDAAQARPLTWKTVVKRVLVVAVAGVAIYLALPKLIAVLGAWPQLSSLNPIWFTVALAAELASFTCNFALQRLALRTRGWFAIVTAGLAGNAVTDSLPGGDAAGATDQPRAGPYRPARHRRLRPVRGLRRDRAARRLATDHARPRGAKRVELGHPRPPAGDRPGPAVAGPARHDPGGAGP